MNITHDEVASIILILAIAATAYSVVPYAMLVFDTRVVRLTTPAKLLPLVAISLWIGWVIYR